MTSSEAIGTHIKTGFPVLPRFSMAADPEAAASSPIVHFVNDLARHNLLQTWQRPALPQYRQIEVVLGEEIHAALKREKTTAQPLPRPNSGSSVSWQPHGPRAEAVTAKYGSLVGTLRGALATSFTHAKQAVRAPGPSA